jgi:hypothetical protein
MMLILYKTNDAVSKQGDIKVNEKAKTYFGEAEVGQQLGLVQIR